MSLNENPSTDLQITDNFSIVNIVGSGDLGDDEFELSLEVLAEELPYETYQNPGDNPGLNMRFDDDDALTTFYESGKFIIRVPHGSKEELLDKYEKVKETLIDLGLIATSEEDAEDALLTLDEVEFKVSNVVCLENLEEEINLPALSIALGLAEVEYEPEEFPALIYRQDDSQCTFMIFANGKVIVLGAKSYDTARDEFEKLLLEMNKWLDGV